jgi:hypothetical protein
MLREWPWFYDFVIYLMYFGADKSVPADLVQAHRLRQRLLSHTGRVSLLASLLEFVDAFGANTVNLYTDLDEIEAREREAEDSFRRDDYDSAEETMDEVDRLLDELDLRAMGVKRSALLWVYLIEWFVVTGAALISGVFLWVVMVRRRLYREIGTTRLS